mmetsp:Transcript_44171/g.112740  ORF Transcript_44171/g.112740 Transcript_44171/m.112740 type:complete len:266 (+) Transcript_44171:2-799(+)|eukprot:jgi/Tetstr1/434386/TSEL_023487.t1
MDPEHRSRATGSSGASGSGGGGGGWHARGGKRRAPHVDGDGNGDPALDFFSPTFDARKALYTPGLAPPMKVKPLDCLARARVLLPAEMPEHVPPASLKRTDRSAESIAAQERAKSRTVVREQQQLKLRGDHNPLQDIMDSVNPKAPVAMLRAVCEARGRVRVVTRHARGVRGVAVGFLVAFDKYLNLLLRDVDEDYVVRVQVARTKVQTVAPAAPGGAGTSAGVEGVTEALQRTRVRWRPKQEKRRRHLKQVLLRGDSVVMVSKA